MSPRSIDERTREIEAAKALLRAAGLGNDALARAQLESLLLYMSPRAELIMRLRYGIGVAQLPTQAQIGAVFGLTKSRIGAIEHQAMRIIRYRIRNGRQHNPIDHAMAYRATTNDKAHQRAAERAKRVEARSLKIKATAAHDAATSADRLTRHNSRNADTDQHIGTAKRLGPLRGVSALLAGALRTR